MKYDKLILSPLGHTWLFDIDGTIVKHNGYKNDGKDTLLTGVKSFFNNLPEEDMVIFITSRSEEFKQLTIDFLTENQIRYNHIIFNAPYGERLIVNDDKPSGLQCSIAIQLKRDHFTLQDIVIDENL